MSSSDQHPELQRSQQTNSLAAITRYTSASDNVSRTIRAYATSFRQCLLCKESHRLIHCDKFINLSPQRRMEFARKN